MTNTTPEQTTAKPVKRQSRATKAAAKNATEPKATVTPIKPKPAKKDEPSVNALKVKIADAMIKFCAEQFVTREMAKELGVPYELLQSEAGRTLSYSPGAAWHKNLVSPETGRGKRHQL